jgi:hypothetical protein
MFRKIAGNFASFAFMGAVLLMILAVQPDALAQLIPLPGGGTETLSGATLKEKVIIGEGLDAFHGFVLGTGYRLVKELIAMIAVFAFVYMGIQMIIANTDEERITRARKGLLMIVFGLAIIAVADALVKNVFIMTGGTFLSDVGGKASPLQKSQMQFNEQMRYITTFVRYLLQGIAFFFVVRSGLALIVAGQESETLDRQKKVFTWGLIGFIFIMSADAIIKTVVFPIDDKSFTTDDTLDITLGETQIQAGVGIITQVINFLLAMAGGVAVFSTIAGAIMYAVAFGHQESTDRGKQIVIGSITGMVIIYSAYTIVNEFVQ